MVRRALPSGISIDRAGLAAARHSRRSRAVGGGSPAHGRRLRGPGESRRSPARQPPLCAVRGRRPRRPASDHGVVARRFRNRHVPGAQLSSVDRRPVAVGAVDPVRYRPRKEQRKGEPRSGATDRGDPSAPRVVSRGVLRPSVGIAQGSARQIHPNADGAGLAGRAASRIRAAGSGRGRDGPRLLLSAEGSWPCAVAVMRVPGGLRRGPRPDWPGRGGVRVVGGWLLCRVPVERLAHARRARPNVAVAVGQRRRRRRPGRPGDLGHRDRRAVWHRPRPRRRTLSTGGATRISCWQPSARNSAPWG